jgi:hypothetical protein
MGCLPHIGRGLRSLELFPYLADKKPGLPADFSSSFGKSFTFFADHTAGVDLASSSASEQTRL